VFDLALRDQHAVLDIVTPNDVNTPNVAAGRVLSSRNTATDEREAARSQAQARHPLNLQVIHSTLSSLSDARNSPTTIDVCRWMNIPDNSVWPHHVCPILLTLAEEDAYIATEHKYTCHPGT